jgi:5-methylcytosine-specific restriction protein A
MGRLQTLKSSLQQLRPTVQPLTTNTHRMRGSGLMARNARWLRIHPLCKHCQDEGGIVTLGQEVDHITPLWKGGLDNEANLQTLCIDHHKVKTKQEAAERSRFGGSA